MAFSIIWAAVLNFLFLVLTCGFILPVFVIKMQHQKEEIGNFRICCFDLRRLALLILLLYIIKLFLGFVRLQNIQIVPCDREQRFIFWIDVILIQFFVALRSRLSLSSTESKLYIFGLIFISLGIFLFLICFIVALVLRPLCWYMPPILKLTLVLHDIGTNLYSLCIFIIPLRKTIELLSAMSDGNLDVKLRLFAKKITFYSSVIIGVNTGLIIFMLVFILANRTLNIFETNTLQSGILLIDCYCVAAQFHVDLDKVDNPRTRRMLIALDCYNLFARSCCVSTLCCPRHSQSDPPSSPQNRERIQSVSANSGKGRTDALTSNSPSSPSTKESENRRTEVNASAGSTEGPSDSKAIEMQTI